MTGPAIKPSWRGLRQEVAIVGSSVVPPLAFFIVFALPYLGGRPTGRFDSPEFYFLVAAFVVFPFSASVVGIVLVSLTRFCTKRGYASLGFMALAGAVVGALLPPLLFVCQQLARITGHGYPPWLVMSGVTAIQATVAFGVVSAITSAVYWWLLDPPSYYQQS